MTIPAKQTRKVGDALILSGELTGDTMPEDAAWEDAVAKINIRTADLETLWVDHGDVTLTLEDDGTKRYQYVGAAPTDDDIGDYVYEIEVTFPSLDDPLTWPNDTTKCKLKIVAQLA